MWYDTKKAILKHLGRNEKSVRSLQRLIDKWVVIEKNGRYAYRCDLEVAHIRKLKEQLKEKGERKSESEERLPWEDGESEELKEAKAQWEYWEAKCREYWRKMNLIVEVVYDVIKPKLGNKIEPFSEFKEAIFEKVRELDSD